MKQGELCKVAIQCKADNGKIGSFLFTGESKTENITKAESRVSPVFRDLVDLHYWTKENKFERVRDGYVKQQKKKKR